ncbi:hypothetical protein [Nocardia brasiliensis]|uniref:hypothetical protein n=1 Tax=Nocardia brasiliensis TaxID=37326 RepID=UPI002458D61D|nr:hypothetical protein [Nocardia brasiliensis]
MCILTFLEPGTSPDLDRLRAGAAANPHGHGYAVITGETITVGHGLDAETVLTEFATVRTRYPDGHALFHSRLATHGPRTVDNCHPFLVGGDARTVLAHNGILPPEVHPGADDPRSDTRIAAEELMPLLPAGTLDTETGRWKFEYWLGTDKMVLLTVDPAYTHQGYVFNERYGHWDQGSWYSNHSYREALWAGAAEDRCTSYYGWCEECGEFNTDPDNPLCGMCGFCVDCSTPFPRCSCPTLDGRERYAELLGLETA